MQSIAFPEYEAWSRRLSTVEEIYRDRVRKRPIKPWGDDWFRRCQYEVDWVTGEWSVVDPPGHGGCGSSSDAGPGQGAGTTAGPHYL